ncbi:aminoglycoside phosphotransferase family protein [Streptomyces marispadix]|uniref:Aminoglycoside phosphotransferase family protein n=1 Tax=Streptomyces marispadix TaxID=2922868 RepID=A0ABS9SZA2_9ACTN|nr:aminoglycoside phosphotransferase family protein [Streptomyces marispadix]MCH6161605.1 aminoglycoside phosphotransferase family protein [Streptomyces marispadix]
MDMHPDQLSVPVETVRGLVDEQFPDWRHLPVRRIASQGTVNAVFRIGDRLSARFPLRGDDVESALRELESEAEAARELAGRTRFPTPEPVALGRPGSGYPLPWSVQTWLPGTVATDEDPAESAAFARDLAEFVHGVRAIGTRGRTFGGRGRGGDLRAHDTWMRTCFKRTEELYDVLPGPFRSVLDVPRLRRVWDAMRTLPPTPAPDVMTHGDLIPGNVLVSRGRLSGILDVGGLGPADPALDLVAAWHLLEEGPRQVLRDELGCDDIQWERGRAWAFEQAMGAVWYYVESNPAMSGMGRRTLERILADTGAVTERAT